MMHKIQARKISSFNQEIWSIFIDGQTLGDVLSAATNDSMYKNLWCAWLLEENQNVWEQEGNYIWKLIKDKQNCNLPILLCADDMDFWCTVVVAQVRFYNKVVVWEKIGVVTGEFDVKKWRESGIRNIATWSETDWSLYGETLSGLNADDKAWEQWWSAHWLDEERRRLWNYVHPYFNDDKNINWLRSERLSFPVDEYDNCIAAFQCDKF